MSNVLDDLTSRFKSFSDTLAGGFDKSFTTIAEGFHRALNVKSKADERHQSNFDTTSKSRNTLFSADYEATRQRAELILQSLPAPFYEQSADPLGHELRQMDDETKRDDIDGVVDGLAAAVEVVSVKLARHVLKNQDKLIAGITNVTEVEDDLKAAHVICHGTRSQLKMAAEEVQRQIKVITCTRRKQAYMEVLEVLCKVKRVQDLQNELRKFNDAGDFAEAVLLCIDCFQAVESLAAFKVAPEMHMTVQRQYFDTQQRIKAALRNECSFFTSDGYSKLLEAYLLQGLSGADLADKIFVCFEECVDDAATCLVRSMVLAKAAVKAGSSDSPSTGPRSNTKRAGCSGLDECSYEDLCKQLSPDAMPLCLTKLLETIFELLCSYHLMARWHEAGMQQQKQVAAAAAAAAAIEAAAQHLSNSGSGSRSSAGLTSVNGFVGQQQEHDMLPSQEQLDQVQAATKGMLQAVSQKLADNRSEILQLAISRVQPLLVHLGKCKSEVFSQVVNMCMQLVGIGEAFTGASLPLQQTLWSVVSSSIETYHKTNMDALKLSLAWEIWQPIISDISVDHMKQSLSTTANPLVQPTVGQPGVTKDFDADIQHGNPFKTRSHMRAVGGQSALPHSSGLPGQAVETQPAATQTVTPTAATASWVATRSSVLVLQCLNSYAALLAPLPGRHSVLWAAVAELFDNFFLACFILFSGVSLEALVWQEDLLPHRLRSALLRITTSKGCKYRAQIEELQQTKPEVPAEVFPSSSLLDFGFMTGSSTPSISSGPSKLDAFTKRFKETMVDLINTDLTQPALGSSMHSPGSYHGVSQQQQSPVLQQPTQRPSVAQLGGTGAVQATVSTGSGSSSINNNSSSTAQQPTQQQQQHVPSGRQFGLKERVVAIESLTAIADALKAARPGLLGQLGSGMAQEVDSYFARTVDTTQDLRDAMYRGGAKQLLMGVVDVEYGTAAQIASCNYYVKEPATAYQPWVEALLKQYRGYHEFVQLLGLPAEVQQKLWMAAVKLGCDAILLGFSRIQHCSLPGRASMSLDLSAVQKGLRALAPSSAMGSFRVVDDYVKAFYIPWDDLARWSQVHLAEYGKAKILMLIETMAEAYGIRKAVKSALIDKLNRELAEFA